MTQHRSLSKYKRELEAQVEAASNAHSSRSEHKYFVLVYGVSVLHSMSDGKSSASTPTTDKTMKNKMKKVKKPADFMAHKYDACVLFRFVASGKLSRIFNQNQHMR